MQDFDLFVFSRALHVIAVVAWIGGVGFVTTVLIPSLKRMPDKENRMDLFEELEGKFALQAKVSTLIAGVTGIYMLEYLNAWSRYQLPEFWWMHLMTFIWGIFTLVLFVLEPLFLHDFFKRMAAQNSDKAFARLQIMHIVLLSLSMIAVLGAVAGSHGLSF